MRVPLTGALLLAALAAQAALIEVPGDFGTIQAALDAAAHGDTILLTAAAYSGEGNRDLDCLGKALVLRSANGRDECVLDAEGSESEPHRVFDFHSGESAATRIEGLGITGGWWASDYYTGGGGIRMAEGSCPTLVGCRIFGNSGSGLYVRDAVDGFLALGCRFEGNLGLNGGGACVINSTGIFQNCEFVGNEAEYFGGAMRFQASSIHILDCDILDNVAPVGAAVGHIYGLWCNLEYCLIQGNASPLPYGGDVLNFHGMVTGTLTGCTFVGNTAQRGVGVVTSKMGHGVLEGCTFWGNDMMDGAVILFGELDGSVSHCIIAGNPGGTALQIGQVVELSCTDIWGNPGGDWTGDLVPYQDINGNLCLDPLLCDPVNGDFHLRADSPCAPLGDCGLIGAWPVGCGIATQSLTWSRVKAMY